MSDYQSDTTINTIVFNPSNAGFMKKRASKATLNQLNDCAAADPTLQVSTLPKKLSIMVSHAPSFPKEIPGMHVSEIIPGLFLGNALNASTMCGRVGAILNMTREDSQCFHPDHSDIPYLHIPILDTCNQNISQYFGTTNRFIDRHIASGIYVHCTAGISRSATIVIAYMMYRNHYTLDQAFDFVKSKRPCISPNLDFMGNLLKYEQAIVSI
jgi:hypothetical protein